MGKTIVSWSPVHGQGTTTSNIAALAAHYALSHENHSVITHTQLNYSSLESLFGKYKTAVKGFEESGLIAIERLIKSQSIKPDAVRDYTETIYSGRLDLLGGSYANNDVTEKMLGKLLKVTEDAYDLVWVDAHSGTRSEITRKTLNNADLVIVNLPQNRFILDHFFLEDFPNELKEKEVIYLISQYNHESKFNIRKMKRQYKISEQVFPIPFSKQFRDAANSSNIADYFYVKTSNPDKLSESIAYMNALQKVNKYINKKFGLSIGDVQE